ncbi:replication licensing factor Cdt1 [Mortierella sp. 14UC]|nr:replication licensing factor Cdt1 [Mortierella sp. 14UC]
MAGGNQTRLGLVHQKPGTRRTLNGKRAVNPASTNGDGKTDELLPTERLLERAGALTQTMEEKLIEYRKGKEEEKRAKNESPSTVSTKNSQSLTKRAEQAHKDSTTQRSLRSMMQSTATKTKTTTMTIATKTTGTTSSQETASFSSSTTLTESIIAIENIDSSVNEAEQDEQDAELEAQEENDAEAINRDAQVQTDDIQALLEKKKGADVESLVEHQQAEEKSEDAGEDSVVPIQEGSPRKSIARKEIVKPVAKDTVQLAEVEDEDNIHPLARTVVKSTTRSIIHRRSHTDDTSNHDSTDKAHQPVNIPSKSLRKIIVQESTISTTLLPLPSHMSALFELFKGLDNVLEFTKRQGQLCFYHKIKRHVQLQSNRNFEIKNLAQLKTILPEGYKLTEAPCLFEGVKTRSILIDTPALEDESEGNFVPENEKRRKLFVKRLYDRIRSHHQTFLSSTTPHRTDTYPYEWHPDFDLETVTPVEESDIPLLKPTVVDTSKLDLKTLGTRRDIVKAPIKAPSVAQEAGSSTSLEKPQPVTAADFPPGAPVTKALSTLEQLKERIRQKQLEKKEQGRGLASPEEKRQALIASRLPAVFDLIRFKRVEVIPLKALTEQVVKSSRQPISEVEGRDSLEMMAKVLPGWCSVFATNDGVKYFKVIRDDGHGNRILHDERALRSRLVSKSTSTVGL